LGWNFIFDLRKCLFDPTLFKLRSLCEFLHWRRHKLILIRFQEGLDDRCLGFFWIVQTLGLRPRQSQLWKAAQAPFVLFLYHVIIEQLQSALKDHRFRHRLCRSVKSYYHDLNLEKSKSTKGLAVYYDHRLAFVFIFLFLIDVFEAGLSCHCIILKAFFCSLF